MDNALTIELELPGGVILRLGRGVCSEDLRIVLEALRSCWRLVVGAKSFSSPSPVVCRRGYSVLFTTVIKMLAQINGGRADGTREKRLAGYLRPDLLILDDFGLKTLRGSEPEDFYEVINERYERASVMVTSNRDYQEWPAAFGENPLMASAALDRLAHRAHLITITGASYRAKERPQSLAKPENQ